VSARAAAVMQIPPLTEQINHSGAEEARSRQLSGRARFPMIVATTSSGMVGAADAASQQNFTTDSLWTCLTVSRFRRMAGWRQTRLDMLSDQVLCGPVWLGVAERLWPLGAI
jgi:hypothetical protein